MRPQVAKAKETECKIDEELKDLQATLANIEEARPFEDLTVRRLYPFESFTLYLTDANYDFTSPFNFTPPLSRCIHSPVHLPTHVLTFAAATAPICFYARSCRSTRSARRTQESRRLSRT